ncbi:hypothetical protein CLF_111225, partial [Clonorchis sinensis]
MSRTKRNRERNENRRSRNKEELNEQEQHIRNCRRLEDIYTVRSSYSYTIQPQIQNTKDFVVSRFTPQWETQRSYFQMLLISSFPVATSCAIHHFADLSHYPPNDDLTSGNHVQHKLEHTRMISSADYAAPHTFQGNFRLESDKLQVVNQHPTKTIEEVFSTTRTRMPYSCTGFSCLVIRDEFSDEHTTSVFTCLLKQTKYSMKPPLVLLGLESPIPTRGFSVHIPKNSSEFRIRYLPKNLQDNGKISDSADFQKGLRSAHNNHRVDQLVLEIVQWPG